MLGSGEMAWRIFLRRFSWVLFVVWGWGCDDVSSDGRGGSNAADARRGIGDMSAGTGTDVAVVTGDASFLRETSQVLGSK